MKIRRWLLVLPVILGPAVGLAAPFTVTFSGTVYSSTLPGVTIGAEVTGSFAIDPSVPDGNPSPGSSIREDAIAFGQLEVRTAGFELAGAPGSSVLYVDDNLPPIGSLPSRDVVSLLWEYGSIATQLDGVALDLDDLTTTALSSDALPFASLDLDAFTSRGGAYTRFRNYQAVGQFSFTIESMAVPEPSVAMFLATSGAAVAAARTRRRPHA
jgi:hypothetical protein